MCLYISWNGNSIMITAREDLSSASIPRRANWLVSSKQTSFRQKMHTWVLGISFSPANCNFCKRYISILPITSNLIFTPSVDARREGQTKKRCSFAGDQSFIIMAGVHARICLTESATTCLSRPRNRGTNRTAREKFFRTWDLVSRKFQSYKSVLN